MFAGEFWEHMLLKLCAASTLLLQAVQGKGAVKGPDISYVQGLFEYLGVYHD